MTSIGRLLDWHTGNTDCCAGFSGSGGLIGPRGQAGKLIVAADTNKLKPNEAPADNAQPHGLNYVNLDEHVVLLSKVAGGKRLTLFTDKLKLHAWLWIQPTSPYFELGYVEIEEAIRTTGLAVTGDSMMKINARLELLREQQQTGQFTQESFRPIEIATGKPSVDGQDGWFEWFIEEPDPEKLRFVPDAQGRINFREMNIVINVNVDDPLVRVHEPTRGEPGSDVFGNAIPAKNGEKKRIGKGKGVRIDEETQTMYAETAGHVEYKNQSIAVSPVYIVEGSVDFNVGNINFRGSVEVRKDVTDGFSIRADQNILVEGIASQAMFFAGGDVEVRGGATASHGRGFIECKGRLLSKYLVNVKADVAGDILVDTQIVNCELSCAGRVFIPQGKLLGGVTIALGGIEANEIGAELGTRTQLIVSVDHFATAETRAIDAEISACEKRLAKIESMLGPYIRDRSLLNELPPSKMESILAQIKELDEVQRQLARMQEDRTRALEPYRSVVSDEIIIHKRIHPGVDVRIDNSRQVFAEHIDGPVKLKPNYARGTIAIHPL